MLSKRYEHSERQLAESSYLDTNIWIYAITAHPDYGLPCKRILEDIEHGRLRGAISTQILSEISGVLFKCFGIRDTTAHLDAVLSYPLEIILVTPDLIRLGAEYSRDYGISPYDSIHIAVAIRYADNILSADKELDKVPFVKRVDPLKYGRTASRASTRRSKRR